MWTRVVAWVRVSTHHWAVPCVYSETVCVWVFLEIWITATKQSANFRGFLFFQGNHHPKLLTSWEPTEMVRWKRHKCARGISANTHLHDKRVDPADRITIDDISSQVRLPYGIVRLEINVHRICLYIVPKILCLGQEDRTLPNKYLGKR